MKKLLHLFCITTFAALPLFAIDDEPKPPQPKEEIKSEEVVKLEETKDEIAIDDMPIIEEDISDDAILKDDNEKEISNTTEIVS